MTQSSSEGERVDGYGIKVNTVIVGPGVEPTASQTITATGQAVPELAFQGIGVLRLRVPIDVKRFDFGAQKMVRTAGPQFRQTSGVGINLQVSSNVVLAELSWTAAEQTQAIDRVHRIGQDQPVTAWRIIAAQTIDARIAELIGQKAGLAARALDGSDEEALTVDVQLEALVTLLTDALTAA